MSLPETVAEYIIAESASLALRGGGLTWSAAASISEASRSLRRLAAACFAERVSIDDALVAHAPDYVRAQAERWQEMAARIEPVKVWVLGRGEKGAGDVTWARRELGGSSGLIVRGDKWEAWDVIAGVWSVVRFGQGGRDAAESWARKETAWVLLDAEPLPEPVTLGRWQTDPTGRRFRSTLGPGTRFCAVAVGPEGWGVATKAGHYPPERSSLAAHGPQTGPEGERLALAAALALGFVEGAQ